MFKVNVDGVKELFAVEECTDGNFYSSDAFL